jgi:REP element-mobilizing transposase RayT
MRAKKEHYRGNLPHYQQPGQWYSITCSLFGAMPKGAMDKYASRLEIAKGNLKIAKTNHDKDDEIISLKKQYVIALNNYRLAYDKALHNSRSPKISLMAEKNRMVMEEALGFWEGKRLMSHAWCIMSNHFHWVLSVFKNDINGNPVYLEDILHSIKFFSARRINANEGTDGQLWTHESFDTTIRNHEHFINVVNYVINNPVSAGLVKDWRDWPGTFLESGTRTFQSP